MNGPIPLCLRRPLRPSELIKSVFQLFVPSRQVDRQPLAFFFEVVGTGRPSLDLLLLIIYVDRSELNFATKVFNLTIRPLQESILGQKFVLKSGDLVIHALELGLQRLRPLLNLSELFLLDLRIVKTLFVPKNSSVHLSG